MQAVPLSALVGQGIDIINANFAELMGLSLSSSLTDIGSGFSVPVLMAMGADNLHWVVPANLAGRPVVFDHGAMLEQSEYSIVGNEVVLVNPPAMPYAISIATNRSGAGITRPIALTQHPTLGATYWLLPDGYGRNVLVYDHGRLLNRNMFRVVNDMVELMYTPTTPFEIYASWGHGGPGVVPPVALEREFPLGMDYQHWLLPKGFGPNVQVIDSGYLLDAADYSVNLVTGKIQLNYVPASPYNISALWGWPLVGQYIHEAELSPAPDGVAQEFLLPEDVLGEVVLLRARETATVSDTFYSQGADFIVEGRRVLFQGAVTPAAGTRLLASFGTPNAYLPAQGTLGANNQTVTVQEGVLLEANTLSQEVTYVGASDVIDTITWYDGVTPVLVITYTYDVEGRVETEAYAANGVTITRTLTYDLNGRFSGSTTTRS